MTTRFSRVLAVLAIAALVSAAFAADGIVPGKMELYPTYSAVGIEVPYGGDDDGNASAEFVWRKAGDGNWHNGVDMTFDRKARLIHASIWPLEQGDRIEVRVTLSDSAAGRLEPLAGDCTVTTLVIEARPGGRVYYVSPKGDDGAEGTREKPWKTLERAVTEAKAGATVLAMSGVYHEGNLFRRLSGEKGMPVFISAAPGEKPVLDGSAEIAKGAVWSEEGGGVYSTGFISPTGFALYAAQDGKRMYLYRSLDDLARDELAVKRAWFYDQTARKLYVRTGDATLPSGHTYNVALYDFAVDFFGARNVVLKGFEIRYYGKAGIAFREGAQSCVAWGNVIHNVPAGIELRDKTTVESTAWRNTIYEEGLVDFSWNAVKASEYPRQGVTGAGGRGTSMCYNTIHGFFDGVSPVSWKHPDELEYNRDFDIMYNTIYNTGDDAIEVDGGGVNMRVHGNRIRNAFAGISLAPIERGPVYCTRNDATYYVIMFKLNVGGCTSNGWTYCYHNSAYSLAAGRQYGGTAISFPPPDGMPISNKVFKNNAFVCDGLGVRYGYDDYSIDYNCYWNVPGGTGPTFSWMVKDKVGAWEKHQYNDLDSFRKATGRDTHGIAADPRFSAAPGLGAVERVDYGPSPFGLYPQSADGSEGDMSLLAESPCIDAGERIRGINDDCAGKAPDIGAFEYGGKAAR